MYFENGLEIVVEVEGGDSALDRCEFWTDLDFEFYEFYLFVLLVHTDHVDVVVDSRNVAERGVDAADFVLVVCFLIVE